MVVVERHAARPAGHTRTAAWARWSVVSAPASVFLAAMRGRGVRSAVRFLVPIRVPSTTARRTCGGTRSASFSSPPTAAGSPAAGPERSSDESFQVYMLGQALSFALVKQGFEPLHATVVVVDDQAVAFLGGNAFGKSSLAACFLEAGVPPVDRRPADPAGIVQPTSSRIPVLRASSCFPRSPGGFSARRANRVRMNPDTDKLILPIDEHRRCGQPRATRRIYALAAPRDACRKPGVRIETLSPREAFVELVKGTFNRRLVSPPRLAASIRRHGGSDRPRRGQEADLSEGDRPAAGSPRDGAGRSRSRYSRRRR